MAPVLEGVAALTLVNRVAFGVVAVDEVLAVELLDGGLVLLVECQGDILHIAKQKADAHRHLAVIVTLLTLYIIRLSHHRDYKPFCKAGYDYWRSRTESNCHLSPRKW